MSFVDSILVRFGPTPSGLSNLAQKKTPWANPGGF